MEVFLIKLLQFILSISLLVLLHEGGHMLASKIFSVRVEKFFIFFDVSIGKWSGKLFSFKPKNSDTEYGMGWLPLGGYCKIAGMIDESMDTEQMKRDPQPWEFRTKPAWQRLIIMVGGVTVNFVLALFIYSMIMFHWGQSYVRMADMTYGMEFNNDAERLGFHDHDILLGTNIRPFKDFNVDVYRDLSQATYADVLRQGKHVRVALPGNINLLDMIKNKPQFVRPFIPAVVDSVVQRMPVAEDSKNTVVSPATAMGLRKGDRIVAFNGKHISSYNDFTDVINHLDSQMTTASTHADSLRLRQVTLVVARTGQDGLAKTDTLTGVLTSDLKVGFQAADVKRLYKVTHIDYGFLESFPAGVRYGWDVLSGYVSDMRYVFSAEGAKSLGRLRCYRLALPESVGLVSVLDDDGFPEHHPGVHEHPAYPGTRRWTRAVPALRDHHATETIRDVHDQSRVHRHHHPHLADGGGQPQRHPTVAGNTIRYC